MVHDRTLTYLAIWRHGGGPADTILWTWIPMNSEIYCLPLLLVMHGIRHNKGVGQWKLLNLILTIVDTGLEDVDLGKSGLQMILITSNQQLFVIPCVTFILSTFASPLPLPNLERRDLFTVYDPNGGDRLFSDDGATRTLSEAEEKGLDVVDDTNDKEDNEDHKDMVELVNRYAPVFKLS